ncbi:5956_t:CDS:2 [Entrophospora sp. SA101]|nr:4215_t:CDS:2 [Entrophospora sp. SA101]CAJ0746454.1 5956_t:CDS:2 [Entrophospora sp. SA101]CAJ0831289.1 13350_t:CDS:2 [Entrophospora sp. SA101]
MKFSYHKIYSASIFALFISYNPVQCLFKHSPEQLINSRLFYLEPARTAFSPNAEPVTYPDKCKLTQLHLNARHGSRFPDPVDTKGFDMLEIAFANVSVTKEYYKNVFPMKKNFQLIKRGEIEPFFDGIQSRKRYAKFWDGVVYDPEVIKFQSSATSRAGASAMSFSEGLFNGKGSVDKAKIQPVYISSVPDTQDPVLLPYVSCPRWIQTVLTNNELLDEQLYAYGNNTLAPIAKRLTAEHAIDPPLDPALVPFIFTNCQFWVTHFNRADTWCSLLSPDELILVRYYYDILGYYILQYGHPFAKNLACGYITQLVNGIDSYINGSSTVMADLKNSHGYTILSTLTALGLFKEEVPLTANFTLEQIKNVKFTEIIAIHWSSTLYFEVYTCEAGQTKIRVLLDFVPFVIPGCESEYCDWNKFKELLSDQIGCDFAAMCAYP